MGQRLLQVLGALAVVMVVAVLARPSQPEVPAPFTVERETPEPAPGPTATPGSTATPDAEPPDDLVVDPPAQSELVVHRVEGRSLDPAGPPTYLPVPSGYVRAELDDLGGRLAVLVSQPSLDPLTIVRVHDTAALEEPPAEVSVPAFLDWFAFAPDGDGLVWLENLERAGLWLSGLTVRDGEAVSLPRVRLPRNIQWLGLTALREGRAAVVVFDETRGAPRGWGLGSARLLVVDLHDREITTDLVLPVSDGILAAEEASRVEWIPGVAWDTARELLYVAHADRDAVVVVDIAASEVEGELVAAEGSIQLAGAYAQQQQGQRVGARRRAVLSDDGSALYVHGYRSGPTPAGEDGSAGEGERTLPLLAVDVRARRILDIEDSPRSHVLAVSPDGSHLLAVERLLPPRTTSMLRLLDGRTLAVDWEIQWGGPSLPRARFSVDGDLLVVAAADDDRTWNEPVEVGLALVAAPTGELLARARYPGALLAIDLDAGLVVVRTPG